MKLHVKKAAYFFKITVLTAGFCLFTLSCNPTPDSKKSPFKYVQDIVVADIIFPSASISMQQLQQKLQEALAKYGKVENSKLLPEKATSILIISANPVFVNKSFSSDSATTLVEIDCSLTCLAKLYANPSIPVKGLIWNKSVIIDSMQEDFISKCQDALDFCFQDLHDHFAKESTTPTFFLANW